MPNTPCIAALVGFEVFVIFSIDLYLLPCLLCHEWEDPVR